MPIHTHAEAKEIDGCPDKRGISTFEGSGRVEACAEYTHMGPEEHQKLAI